MPSYAINQVKVYSQRPQLNTVPVYTNALVYLAVIAPESELPIVALRLLRLHWGVRHARRGGGGHILKETLFLLRLFKRTITAVFNLTVL